MHKKFYAHEWGFKISPFPCKFANFSFELKLEVIFRSICIREYTERHAEAFAVEINSSGQLVSSDRAGGRDFKSILFRWLLFLGSLSSGHPLVSGNSPANARAAGRRNLYFSIATGR